jgi:hypothetical protein
MITAARPTADDDTGAILTLPAATVATAMQGHGELAGGPGCALDACLDDSAV